MKSSIILATLLSLAVASPTTITKRDDILCGRGMPKCPSGSICRPSEIDPLVQDDMICWKLCGNTFPLDCGAGKVCNHEIISELTNSSDAQGRCKAPIPVGNKDEPCGGSDFTQCAPGLKCQIVTGADGKPIGTGKFTCKA